VAIRLLILCLLALPVMADQVTLKNGDRITGQIVKKDGDKLFVKSELMGDVTIPWAAVTAITSSGPLVVLPGGRSLNGSLTSSGSRLQVAAAAGTQTASLTEVSAIRNPEEQKQWERLQHPGLFELWAGYVDLGLSLARGNAETTTFTTAFHAVRATRTDKLTVDLNEIYATAEVAGKTSGTAQAVRGGLSYNRNVGPRLFINLFNNQYNTNYRYWYPGTWSSRVRVWTFEKGSTVDSALVTPSLEARNPLAASVADGPAGTLPLTQSGVSVSRPGVLVTAFGDDPDGNSGTLLRTWDQSGVAGQLTVELPARVCASAAATSERSAW